MADVLDRSRHGDSFTIVGFRVEQIRDPQVWIPRADADDVAVVFVVVDIVRLRTAVDGGSCGRGSMCD